MLPAAHNEGKRSMFQKRESGNQFPAETDEKSHVYIVQPKWWMIQPLFCYIHGLFLTAIVSIFENYAEMW